MENKENSFNEIRKKQILIIGGNIIRKLKDLFKSTDEIGMSKTLDLSATYIDSYYEIIFDQKDFLFINSVSVQESALNTLFHIANKLSDEQTAYILPGIIGSLVELLVGPQKVNSKNLAKSLNIISFVIIKLFDEKSLTFLKAKENEEYANESIINSIYDIIQGENLKEKANPEKQKKIEKEKEKEEVEEEGKIVLLSRKWKNQNIEKIIQATEILYNKMHVLPLDNYIFKESISNFSSNLMSHCPIQFGSIFHILISFFSNSTIDFESEIDFKKFQEYSKFLSSSNIHTLENKLIEKLDSIIHLKSKDLLHLIEANFKEIIGISLLLKDQNINIQEKSIPNIVISLERLYEIRKELFVKESQTLQMEDVNKITEGKLKSVESYYNQILLYFSDKFKFFEKQKNIFMGSIKMLNNIPFSIRKCAFEQYLNELENIPEIISDERTHLLISQFMVLIGISNDKVEMSSQLFEIFLTCGYSEVKSNQEISELYYTILCYSLSLILKKDIILIDPFQLQKLIIICLICQSISYDYVSIASTLLNKQIIKKFGEKVFEEHIDSIIDYINCRLLIIGVNSNRKPPSLILQSLFHNYNAKMQERAKWVLETYIKSYDFLYKNSNIFGVDAFFDILKVVFQNISSKDSSKLFNNEGNLIRKILLRTQPMLSDQWLVTSIKWIQTLNYSLSLLNDCKLVNESEVLFLKEEPENASVPNVLRSLMYEIKGYIIFCLEYNSDKLKSKTFKMLSSFAVIANEFFDVNFRFVKEFWPVLKKFLKTELSLSMIKIKCISNCIQFISKISAESLKLIIGDVLNTIFSLLSIKDPDYYITLEYFLVYIKEIVSNVKVIIRKPKSLCEFKKDINSISLVLPKYKNNIIFNLLNKINEGIIQETTRILSSS